MHEFELVHSWLDYHYSLRQASQCRLLKDIAHPSDASRNSTWHLFFKKVKDFS